MIRVAGEAAGWRGFVELFELESVGLELLAKGLERAGPARADVALTARKLGLGRKFRLRDGLLRGERDGRDDRRRGHSGEQCRYHDGRAVRTISFHGCPRFRDLKVLRRHLIANLTRVQRSLRLF